MYFNNYQCMASSPPLPVRPAPAMTFKSQSLLLDGDVSNNKKQNGQNLYFLEEQKKHSKFEHKDRTNSLGTTQK